MDKVPPTKDKMSRHEPITPKGCKRALHKGLNDAYHVNLVMGAWVNILTDRVRKEIDCCREVLYLKIIISQEKITDCVEGSCEL